MHRSATTTSNYIELSDPDPLYTFLLQTESMLSIIISMATSKYQSIHGNPVCGSIFIRLALPTTLPDPSLLV